jgi:divalent metal cation (Fe/Co/Zn/Cd) transporter
MSISIALAIESRSLLMGETASKKTLKEIVQITEQDPSVIKVIHHFSMYMSPEEIVLQLIAAFKDDLNTKQISTAIERIQNKIQKRFPRIKQIFIQPEAL